MLFGKNLSLVFTNTLVMRYRFLLLSLTGLIIFTSPDSSKAASIIKHGSAVLALPWKYLRANEFIKMSVKDFNQLTGKKMNLIQRVSFHLLKQRMKQEMKKNPSLTVNEYLNSHRKKMKTWLKIVLIIVGAILIAFLIFALAYGGVI